MEPAHDHQHYEQAPQDTNSHSVHDQSPVIPGTNLPIQTDVVNLENPVDTREDRYNNPNVRNEDDVIPRKPGPEKMEIDFERASTEARWPGFTTFTEELEVTESTVQISPLMGLEEDPHSPKSFPAKIPPSNYQAKVTDPTGHGGKEAEVAPLLERLDNFHIHDKSQSHDQIAPQSTPTVDQFTPESNPVNPSKIPESSDQAARPESMPRDTIAGKISSATSAMAGKAVTAKDMVTSKLGYDDVSSTAADYGHKVAEKLAPVYEKVTAAMQSVERGGGDAVAGRGSGGGFSVKEYLAEKLRPGEEDKALSEAITGRFYKRREGMAPGRVVEAEARSGTGEEASGSGGSGSGGVVDRLKGAVGLWIGKRSTGVGLSDGSVPVIKEEIESQPKVQESSIRQSDD